MQFHLNGFRAGDPSRQEEHQVDPPITPLPDQIDVLIVGCGPAGLTLAAQLAAFPDIKTCIVEQKPGPLRLGQADGVACRTMETFNALGFSERLLKEAYWVNETTFWKPDPDHATHIVRSGRIQDVEDGLSEFPHVILNQARVHDFLLDAMRNAPARLEPAYSRKLIGLQISSDAGKTHPATVRLKRTDPAQEGKEETIRARYVVGCDGARSAVRQLIGRTLTGDSANQAWGVMDVLAVTDFPDIRFKALIQSATEGNIVLIPREGGYLVRIYVEMDELKADERVANRKITVDDLIAATQRILRPYSFEVKEVPWWSVYEIGQRLCDKFDDVAIGDETTVPRVFIAGDACHTHSPKAGQGMNVSIQDAFNLGWKLAVVLRGQADPRLLHTYSAERQAIAKELIDFDREWARMISARPSNSAGDGVDPAEVQRYFTKQGRFTAGTATTYVPSIITGDTAHQHLAKGFPIGMRFHSAPVIRYADAKQVHLGHVIEADGRWRLIIFTSKDDPAPKSAVDQLCTFLAESPDSPINRFTPAGGDVDSVVDVCAVFQQSHRDLMVDYLHPILRPQKGKLRLRDYEKVFCADCEGGEDIFDMRGIDRVAGCVIVVRPDQFVAQISPLDNPLKLAAFFSRFMSAPTQVMLD